MEDIQDGIKVSIQDGITEDPTLPAYTGTKLSTIGYDYGTALSSKEITTELETSTDSEDIDCTIATVLGTAVA